MPELTKYYYKHDKGIRRLSGSRTETSMKGGGELAKESMTKALEDKGMITVKVENPAWVETKSLLTTMKSGKAKLDKHYAECESMLSFLFAKMGKKGPDSHTAEKAHDDLKACMKTMKTFTNNMMETMGTAEVVEKEDDCNELPKEMKALINSAVIHCDGCRAMLKRYHSTWRATSS